MKLLILLLIFGLAGSQRFSSWRSRSYRQPTLLSSIVDSLQRYSQRSPYSSLQSPRVQSPRTLRQNTYNRRYPSYQASSRPPPRPTQRPVPQRVAYAPAYTTPRPQLYQRPARRDYREYTNPSQPRRATQRYRSPSAEVVKRPVARVQYPTAKKVVQKTSYTPKTVDRTPTVSNSAPKYDESCPKRDWSPCVKQSDADHRFLSCCKDRGLPSGCHELCNFRQDRQDLEQAFWWRRTCPVTVIPLYMYCASNGEDARPCCKAHDVTTGSRSLCSPFCYPGGGIPAFQVKYIKCLTQLESIVKCYRAHHQPVSTLRKHLNFVEQL